MRNRKLVSVPCPSARARTPGARSDNLLKLALLNTVPRTKGRMQRTNKPRATNPRARRLNSRRQNSSHREKIRKQSSQLRTATANMGPAVFMEERKWGQRESPATAQSARASETALRDKTVQIFPVPVRR